MTLWDIHKQQELMSKSAFVKFHPLNSAFSLILLIHVILFLLFYFKKALNNEEEVFQSLSWKADGSVLVTTSKDKKVRIWDPRANSVTHSADSHSSNRESVTTWLGASNRILTSGFDSVKKNQQKTNKINLLFVYLKKCGSIYVLFF